MMITGALLKKILAYIGSGFLWTIYAVFLPLYLGAMLAPFIAPTRTQIPAFLNLAFPILLIFAFALLILLVLYRKWVLLGVHVLLLIFSWGYIRSYCPINTGSGLSKDRDLRVMTYNVMEFRECDPITGRPRVADVIQHYSPDIVCLQEGRFSMNEQKNRRMLKQVFGAEYPYIHSIAQKGLTILSRYTIAEDESIYYDSYRNGSHIYLLRLDNDLTLLLVNNHMESYSLGHREKKRFKDYIRALRLRDIPGQFLEIKHRLGPMLNQRSGAARKVRSDTESAETKYTPQATIVLGDLNDTPMSYTYHQLRDTRADAFASTGCGIGVTYNEPPLAFRIDHLFYGGALKAIGSKIPQTKGCSDHHPLIVDFVIRK